MKPKIQPDNPKLVAEYDAKRNRQPKQKESSLLLERGKFRSISPEEQKRRDDDRRIARDKKALEEAKKEQVEYRKLHGADNPTLQEINRQRKQLREERLSKQLDADINRAVSKERN